jgi:hypothetical protein
VGRSDVSYYCGLGYGFHRLRSRPDAAKIGRFVAILPTIYFMLGFLSSLAEFSFSRAVDNCLADQGGLEVTLGAISYSVSIAMK